MPIKTLPASQDPRKTGSSLPLHKNPGPPPPFTALDYPRLPSQTSPIGVLSIFPLEVRESIYEEAMLAGHLLHCQYTAESDRSGWGGTNRLRFKYLPAICLARGTVYQEATPVFLRNTTWVIRSGAGNAFFTRFLETFPDNKAFEAVRDLRFPSFHWYKGPDVFPENMDFQLMSRCMGLKHIEFTFHKERLARRAPEGSDTLFELKSVEEIVAFYALENIFACADLKSILIDGIDYWFHERNCDGSPSQRLHDVLDWITTGFRERYGKELTATIKWRSHRYTTYDDYYV